MNKLSLQETIFALSTPYGTSAIAVVRISGRKSLEVAKILTKKKNPEARKVYFSRIFSTKGETIDKGLIIFFKSPHSYTGEDMLEIHTHGSIAIINKILDELSIIDGCRFAQPGEFSKRAFINDKNDLIHFEGLATLISAETELERRVSVKQTFGEAQNICDIWRRTIIENLSILEAEIDFSDEGETFNFEIVEKNIKKLVSNAKKVVKSSTIFRKSFEGLKLLIFGPPNTGKSTLYNIICQEDKAITSPIQGTTTDHISASINIFGKKATITDSAGLRESKHSVEISGISKTLKSLKSFRNLVLVLSPDSFSLNNCKTIMNLIEKIYDQNLVVIYNKKDLSSFEMAKKKWIKNVPYLKKFKSISISCINHHLQNNILIKISQFLNKNILSVDTNSNEDYYSFEAKQIQIINEMIAELELSLKNLEEIEICTNFLAKALSKLDMLYGKNNIEDRLGFIFNKFCIGK